MRKLLSRFCRDEKGLETVEYAIIAGVIVVATIATIISIGGWVNARFVTVDNGLSSSP